MAAPNPKKELAKLLYMNFPELSQKQIVERVGTTEKSFTTWKKAEHWEDLRCSFLVTPDQELKRMLMQVGELNTKIMNRPVGERFANAKEADALVKITAAVKNLTQEGDMPDIIAVARKMITWLQKQEDLEQAQDLTRLFDAFISDQLKK
jgi:hypothetical protein